MNKKTIISVSIVVIITILLIVLNDRYVNGTKTLVCYFQPDYTNYDETLKFIYKNNVLVEYYREEVFNDEGDSTVEEIYEYMYGLTQEVESNEDFKYTAELKDNKVYINTYINLEKYKKNFDNYAGGLNVSSDYDIDTMKQELNKTNYICSIK